MSYVGANINGEGTKEVNEMRFCCKLLLINVMSLPVNCKCSWCKWVYKGMDGVPIMRQQLMGGLLEQENFWSKPPPIF